MSDTDSTPDEGPAGEVVSVDSTPDLADVTVDTAIESAIEEHFEDETPSGPGRDEKGRFTSKDGDEPPKPAEEEPEAEENPDEAPPEEASGEGDEDQVTEEADSKPKPEPPLDPPQHWSDADKARFATMPKDAQEWALERDRAMTADYTRKTQEAAQVRQQFQPLSQVLEPVRTTLQQRGVSEAEYVGRLMEADRLLQTDPVGAIRWLAGQAGLDLASLEPWEGYEPDPQIAALQNRVEQLSNHVTEQERLAAETRTQELNTQIESFQNKTDSDGNLQHPHFEAVRHVMGGLIQAGQATAMDDAYAKAVRLDDNLYQQTLNAERKKAEAAEEKRRKEAVEKAKKVQPKVSSNPPKGTTTSDNLDDLLSSAIDQAGIG